MSEMAPYVDLPHTIAMELLEGQTPRHRLAVSRELGARVGGAVGIGAIIVAAVFVLVSEIHVGFGQGEGSQESIAGSYGDFALCGV